MQMSKIRVLISGRRRLIATITIIAMVLGIYAWVFADLPPIDRLTAGLALPSTRIYDRNGILLYEILPPEQGRHTAIPLESIPNHCINALIATEDANYWSHPGVDIIGVLRALWINIRGGEVVAGGSTITQQVARLLLLDPHQRAERSLQRKLKEMVLAIQLQSAYSKEDILALYLNQAYFGNLAYGIEAAARAYFGKGASELALSECALLIGILQNPAYYDPLANPQVAKARQKIVLDLMVANGYLAPSAADSAHRDRLQFAPTPFPIRAPHAVMAVWKQLERQFPDQLYQVGLDVVTTVDVRWQKAAEAIVRRQLAIINDPTRTDRPSANARNAAVVALDPHSGQVLVLLGSPNYFDESIDGAVNAALALRQPGSALKPFTYALAMNPNHPQPYTPATMLLDVETPFVTRKLESYTPANYALVEHGPVSLREALANSYNIPAVIALEHVGLTRFKQFMADVGLVNLAMNAEVDLSITLGGGEVRLLDLSAAYAIFANGGYRVEPVLIQSVRDRAGHLLYQWTPPVFTEFTLDPRVAYLITNILSDDEARIPSFGRYSALNIGRPSAAKTGTTTDFRDNWVVGYTPDIVVGVWVGNADNTPMTDITGISGAGPIWNSFIRHVLNGQPERDFVRPEGIVSREVCIPSGLIPTPDCPRRRVELFIAGTEPKDYDTLYQRYLIDSASGALANEETPPERRVEKIYLVLPQEARDWGARQGISPPPTRELVAWPDMTAGLRLLEPDPYTIFELSPILPRAAQRIKLTVGAPPQTQSVTYYLNGQPLATVSSAPWAYWWTLEVGQHQLVARALLADETRIESSPISFTVVDWGERGELLKPSLDDTDLADYSE